MKKELADIKNEMMKKELEEIKRERMKKELADIKAEREVKPIVPKSEYNPMRNPLLIPAMIVAMLALLAAGYLISTLYSIQRHQHGGSVRIELFATCFRKYPVY